MISRLAAASVTSTRRLGLAHSELNLRGVKRADWLLPDGTMVEAAGMLDDTGYAERMALSCAVVAASDIPLLIITPEMVLSLGRVFARWVSETN